MSLLLPHVPVSVGELIDKLTILEIKRRKIDDPLRLENICRERDLLESVVDEYGLMKIESLTQLRERLVEINERLWGIEDQIRLLENRKDFGQKFIDLARSVYRTNDQRADLKREINLLVGSSLVEEKSYTPY